MSMSDYIFEPTERYSNDFPVPALLVHSKSECGKEFAAIAAFLEPAGPAPCLVLSMPLGINAVRELLDAFQEKT